MPFHRECALDVCLPEKISVAMARAVGLSRDKDIQWSADHGQTTAVIKSFSGEIALQQLNFILQEIAYRPGVRWRMKVLVASTPLTGRINPMASIGHSMVPEACLVTGYYL